MIYKILPLVTVFLMSLSSTDVKVSKSKNIAAAPVTAEASFEAKADAVYSSLHSDSNIALPQAVSFKKALEGFYKLKATGAVKRDILTLVDFSISSNKKRMWIIDLKTNTILYNSLVAHGRNTGEEFANAFSNKEQSYKSSLGFYTTGEVYNGKHGMSLKLDGLEKGVNDNARNRAVVIHGADYVSESFIKNHSRLGRSQGCPAIPVEMTKTIINTIKNKSLLYIYHPSKTKNALVS